MTQARQALGDAVLALVCGIDGNTEEADLPVVKKARWRASASKAARPCGDPAKP